MSAHPRVSMVAEQSCLDIDFVLFHSSWRGCIQIHIVVFDFSCFVSCLFCTFPSFPHCTVLVPVFLVSSYLLIYNCLVSLIMYTLCLVWRPPISYLLYCTILCISSCTTSPILLWLYFTATVLTFCFYSVYLPISPSIFFILFVLQERGLGIGSPPRFQRTSCFFSIYTKVFCFCFFFILFWFWEEYQLVLHS